MLGHLGARGTAWWNVVFLDAIFDFAEIRVTSARPESREEFARGLSEHLDKEVWAVATSQEALEGADIMVEASRLSEPSPLLRTEWVAPGTFVCPYGTVSAVERSLTSVIDKGPGPLMGSLRRVVSATRHFVGSRPIAQDVAD